MRPESAPPTAAEATLSCVATGSAPLAESTRVAGQSIAMRSSQFTVLVVAALFFALGLSPNLAIGQGGGTIPTPEMLGGDQGLVPDAYLFLDETQSRVIMPGLTWEEFDRLLRLDRGRDDQTQAFAMQSLAIEGTAEKNRSELDVMLSVVVDSESPEGQWTAIPLKMKTFRLLDALAVRAVGADPNQNVEHRITVAPDGSGYVLLVRAKASTELRIRGRFAVRVDGETEQTIAFDLPRVPTSVQIDVRGESIDASVDGTDDEVLALAPRPSGRQRIRVDSSGGAFTLRWGEQRKSRDDAPLLSVVSKVAIDWTMPQNQPVMSVSMTVKNLRGPLGSFEISLPSQSILDDTPSHDSTQTDVMVDGPFADDLTGGEKLRVTIPDQLRLSDIVIQFGLRLEANSVSGSDPLLMRIPQVINTTRHSGELSIRTGSDYRLRWLSTPFVRNTINLDASDESGSLTQFLFDRGLFELPTWLVANQRQLRLAIDNSLRFVAETAELTMVISPQGFVEDNRLSLEANGWLVRSIVDVETREVLDVQVIDGASEVKLNARGGGDAAAIRVIAEKAIDPEGQIELTLPQVIGNSDDLIVQRSDLHVISDGRKTLVVDQAASARLDRVTTSAVIADSGVSQSTFRVFPPDARPIVVGRLAAQQLLIELESKATIELIGDQVHSAFDWDLASEFDLEGRLAVRFVGERGLGPAIQGQQGPDAETIPVDELASENTEADEDIAAEWMVAVDGVEAILRRSESNHYELISDRLTRGNMTVRWTRIDSAEPLIKPIPSSELTRTPAIVAIPVPTPVRVDVTVPGSLSTELIGNDAYDLVSDSITANAENNSDGSIAQLNTLPRRPIRLTARRRVMKATDLTIQRALVRTVVGEATRLEQVIASVHGGSAFRVGVPTNVGEISIAASVDGLEVAAAYRDGLIEIAIPDSDQRHLVSLQIWCPETASGMIKRVKSELRLPRAIDRVYWRLITPSDQHCVWSSGTTGRAMSWAVDGWRLYREPAQSDRELMNWIASGTPVEALTTSFSADPTRRVDPSIEADNASDSEPIRRILADVPPGNSYLYVGADFLSFEIRSVSRASLWAIVGSIVLAFASLLTYFPVLRSPLLVVASGVAYAGLIAVAPDAAVLGGQVAVVAGVLVVVKMTIRSQLRIAPEGRVLTTNTRPADHEGSTRTGYQHSVDSQRSGQSRPKQDEGPGPERSGRRSSLTATHSMPGDVVRETDSMPMNTTESDISDGSREHQSASHTGKSFNDPAGPARSRDPNHSQDPERSHGPETSSDSGAST